MITPEIVLYHCPGACSQVAVCALEMAGLPYRLELVDIHKGQQTGAEYLTIAPLGKVPYAIIDGEGLGENVAILNYIATLRPDSGVFPAIATARDRAEIAGGLSFCSGTLHPIVRGMLNPARMTSGDTDGVREMSTKLAEKSFGFAEKRLSAKNGWWLGVVSIVDVYLNWTVSASRKAGFAIQPYPNLDRLADRLKNALPAFTAMLAEEDASQIQLGL